MAEAGPPVGTILLASQMHSARHHRQICTAMTSAAPRARADTLAAGRWAVVAGHRAGRCCDTRFDRSIPRPIAQR